MPLCYNLFHICFLIWWHQVVLLHKYNSSNGTYVVGCRGVVQQGVLVRDSGNNFRVPEIGSDNSRSSFKSLKKIQTKIEQVLRI